MIISFMVGGLVVSIADALEGSDSTDAPDTREKKGGY